MIRCDLFGHRSDLSVIPSAYWRQRPARYCSRCEEWYFVSFAPLCRWFVIIAALVTVWSFGAADAHDFGVKPGDIEEPGDQLVVRITSSEGVYYVHLPVPVKTHDVEISVMAVNDAGEMTCSTVGKRIESESCRYDVDNSQFVLGGDHALWLDGWKRNAGKQCVRTEEE